MAIILSGGGVLAKRGHSLSGVPCRRVAVGLASACMLALAALCTPVPAHAQSVSNVAYVDEQGASRSVSSATVVTQETTELASGWYVVQDEIELGKRLAISGDVHLVLADGAVLNTTDGVGVPLGAHLHVYGQEAQTGALNATKDLGLRHCGIGATGQYDGGDITINGGVITAEAGEYAAAIGGPPDKKGGSVTINGGTVTATGNNAAAIGGGRHGWSGAVTINGGTVKATAGYWDGAAIGTSDQGYAPGDNANGDVTINGGVVYSHGAIGAGEGGKAISVHVNGGLVKFMSSDGFATSNTTVNLVFGMVERLSTCTVYGSFALPQSYTVSNNVQLTIPDGAELTIPAGITLSSQGDIENRGSITGEGRIHNTKTVLNYGTIGAQVTNEGKIYTMTNLPEGTGGEIVYGPSLSAGSGRVTVDDQAVEGETTVPAGAKVTVTCDATSEDGTFARWSVILGWKHLQDLDLTSRTISFTMPNDFLVLEPRYSVAAATITLEDGSILSYDHIEFAMDEWSRWPSSTLTIVGDVRRPLLMTGLPEGGVLDLGGKSVEVYCQLPEGLSRLTIKNGEFKLDNDFEVPEGLDLHFKNVVILPAGEVEARVITANGRIIDAGGLVIDPRVSIQGGNSSVFDGVEPVISGVVDGGVYRNGVKIVVSDANLNTVTLNGERVELSGSPLGAVIELAPGAVDMEYTLVAADDAGNIAKAVFTMKAASQVDPDDGSGQGGSTPEPDQGDGGSDDGQGGSGQDQGSGGGGSQGDQGSDQGGQGETGSGQNDSGSSQNPADAGAAQDRNPGEGSSAALPETGDSTAAGVATSIGVPLLAASVLTLRSRRGPRAR